MEHDWTQQQSMLNEMCWEVFPGWRVTPEPPRVEARRLTVAEVEYNLLANEALDIVLQNDAVLAYRAEILAGMWKRKLDYSRQTAVARRRRLRIMNDRRQESVGPGVFDDKRLYELIREHNRFDSKLEYPNDPWMWKGDRGYIRYGVGIIPRRIRWPRGWAPLPPRNTYQPMERQWRPGISWAMTHCLRFINVDYGWEDLMSDYAQGPHANHS